MEHKIYPNGADVLFYTANGAPHVVIIKRSGYDAGPGVTGYGLPPCGSSAGGIALGYGLPPELIS